MALATEAERMEQPILKYLRDDDRSIGWLARKIAYSYPHTWQVLHGNEPGSPMFRARCAELLGVPESDLFLPKEEAA